MFSILGPEPQYCQNDHRCESNAMFSYVQKQYGAHNGNYEMPLCYSHIMNAGIHVNVI